MKEDLAIAKNNILQLQQENSLLHNEKESMTEQHTKLMEVGRNARVRTFGVGHVYSFHVAVFVVAGCGRRWLKLN